MEKSNFEETMFNAVYGSCEDYGLSEDAKLLKGAYEKKKSSKGMDFINASNEYVKLLEGAQTKLRIEVEYIFCTEGCKNLGIEKGNLDELYNGVKSDQSLMNEYFAATSSLKSKIFPRRGR